MPEKSILRTHSKKAKLFDYIKNKPLSPIQFSYGSQDIVWWFCKKHNFRIKKGSSGPDVVDLTSFFAKTGMFIYDPGFTSTASCSSQITYIDGEQGILRYRGYPIEELAKGTPFTDVAHLLIYGHMDESEQKINFKKEIKRQANIHEDMKRFFDGFPLTAHPMAILSSMVTALSAFSPDSDSQNIETLQLFSLRRNNFLCLLY